MALFEQKHREVGFKKVKRLSEQAFAWLHWEMEISLQLTFLKCFYAHLDNSDLQYSRNILPYFYKNAGTLIEPFRSFSQFCSSSWTEKITAAN